MNGAAYRLKGKVRHYAWGGDAFLPQLLDLPPQNEPWAEYWLGAHASDPADILLDGTWRPMDGLIRSDPERWLGRQVQRRFGELPYLMKVLDVARPLSIQVHPNATQARAGFRAENDRGLSADDPRRNFKDPNAKPELAIALSQFWLLYGFRPLPAIKQQLARFSSLAELGEAAERGGIEAVFRFAMSGNEPQLHRWLRPVIEQAADETSAQSDPLYWIRQWRELHPTPQEAVDRGVFGFLLMNIEQLQPGDSIFQDANVPHAYLKGRCAEIMANSDNVLRGGLTPKHVDVPALLAHTSTEPTEFIQRQPPGQLDAFAMAVLDPAARPQITGPTCGLVLDGYADLGPFHARRGDGFFVPGDRTVTLAGQGKTLVGHPAVLT